MKKTIAILVFSLGLLNVSGQTNPNIVKGDGVERYAIPDSVHLQVNSIRVDPHPTFKAFDKSSNLLFWWHEGSDTLYIDTTRIRKIIYFKP